jgi:glycosyltransferase 2 family protein
MTESPQRKSWLLDLRVWGGLVVTGGCVAYALRGVPLREVATAVREVDFLPLLLLSAPFHVLSVWLRALRWRHLTEPIAPLSRGSLFRATSIGFAVNNLLPLRIGELVRVWALAREHGVSAGAVLGTVVLERMLDVASVLLLAVGALAWLGTGGEGGGVLQQGSRLLIPVAVAPLLGLLVLRVAPDPTIRLAVFCLRPFPAAFASFGERALRSFISGLGALRGGRHLVWIALHSLTIWLVASTVPLLVGLWAFGVELGGPLDTLLTSWVLLGAIGVAVAIPSAPGFVGPYQLAFSAVLVRYGVEPAEALAMGVLVWLAFWLTLTGLGLLALRSGPLRLAELLTSPPAGPRPHRQ